MSDTVKLIIEIPKKVKQEFDKIESIALKGAYFDLDGIIGKAIQNGIPLEADVISIDQANAMIKSYVSHYEGNEELRENIEKAKAEIVALPKTYPFINHIDTYVKEDDVLHILDNIIGKESEE